ncbi:hypothetical protein G6F23_013524 [Rhizopus arrhizus]|nr:hypothetical protein G6F23_013524 [Rhizopus arrhizus]
MPACHLDQQAAQSGTKNRTNLTRDRHKSQCGNVLIARHPAQHRQPSARHQHGPTPALDHARNGQLRQGLRHGAEHRSHREYQDCRQVHTTGAVAVSQPARGRRQHGHRQGVRHHDRLQRKRLLAKAARHGGPRRIDDRSVQRLHEKAGSDDPTQGLL